MQVSALPAAVKPRRGPKCKDPRIVKVQMALKLPRWMIEWLNGQPYSRAHLIEKAILRQYRLTPPESLEGPGGAAPPGRRD